jgi:hypothetical protein
VTPRGGGAFAPLWHVGIRRRDCGAGTAALDVVACDASPVAAVPAATRGVLSERGLITHAAPSLSALTGVRPRVAGDILTIEGGNVGDRIMISRTRREEHNAP